MMMITRREFKLAAGPAPGPSHGHASGDPTAVTGSLLLSVKYHRRLLPRLYSKVLVLLAVHLLGSSQCRHCDCWLGHQDYDLSKL
jgi:hypothetical protein